MGVRQPTAKSVVLDLLSTMPEGEMPVRALVAAAGLFDIAENNVRVALARLLAARLATRDERGCYRLGARSEAVGAQVSSWRTIETRVRPWKGDWLGVHTAGLPRTDRRALAAQHRALRFTGFRALAPGLEIRPDNLAGGIAVVRTRLAALGLVPAAPVFVLSDLDATTASRARRLWDAGALATTYRDLRTALERSEARLASLPPARAMVESFLLGGRAIHALALDPLLPEPIVRTAERAALVVAMRRYDRAGRRVWAVFLAGFGLPHLGAATDTSLHTPTDGLAVAAGGLT